MAVVSSHTLNGADGTHAGGIAVRLVNLSMGAELFSTTMDEGGRLAHTVDLAETDPGDFYELTFATGPYWAALGHEGPHVIQEIVLRFAMPDPSARYHSPIILSPFGYSTWASLPE